MNYGNVSDVLLKFQQLANQYNIKELNLYFPLPHYRDKCFSSL